MLIAIVFFLRADNKPEETKHSLNLIRPFRYSKSISAKELKTLIDDRPVQLQSPTVSWKSVILNLDIWCFIIAWFSATLCRKFKKQ